jgi:hypothetical protein
MKLIDAIGLGIIYSMKKKEALLFPVRRWKRKKIYFSEWLQEWINPEIYRIDDTSLFQRQDN